MRYRTLTAAAALPLACFANQAAAQVVSTPVQPAAAGWTFNLTPYFWLATFRADLGFTGPQGNTVSQSITAGINNYISNLNFAFMGGAEARYDRFSVLTDLIYASLTFKNDFGIDRLRYVNVEGQPIPILRNQQLFTGSRTNSTIGSIAGGYTLASGAWGNVDAIAGLRILGMSSDFNYTLTNDITLPGGTVALSRSANLSNGASFVEGIGGIRGRINLTGDGRFFVPYYADAGGGEIPFTWQVYAGLGYRTSFADFSIGYRWLDFQQNGKTKPVQNLAMGGAVLAAAFRF